ncbi:queuine tRNA-ribosyltransferase accessory subunit 2 [Ischnura elegans]|uniref:queuine tRNA-ribosyltransferase accessory subunit 2 n=1 Tax=Ischnura elegans TaxID=197161 RepID=UPI001ED8A4BD|nr:queuine tRNA-ribosyltransferase accessory subunit 2 [Ischnura elegans]
MRFAISAVSNTSRARLGSLSCFRRIPDICLETPVLLLHSKGGCIPHLTLDVLELVSKDPLCIQLPLSSTISCHIPLQEFKRGIGDFIGMKNNPIYCTVQDPANSSPVGYNELDKVSIWSRSGREPVDPERYMDIMESFLPDMYQCLGDGETDINSTNKRILKSMKRSLDMFHKCLDRHKKSEVLKNSAFLALLQGGYDISSRVSFAKDVSASDVDGYVIDGLHGNGEEVEFFEYEKAKPVIKETIKVLPEDKFRVVHGCWSPEAVLHLVEEGIDAFDSSFPFIVTERGAALTFCFKPGEESKGCPSSLGENGMNELDSAHLKSDNDSSLKEYMYEINLENKKYADDFGPLLKDCSCYCCSQHTRAYIHHLITNKELLARVLLMMHNLHHYLEFFKEIRRAIKEDSLRNLKVRISQGKTE